MASFAERLGALLERSGLTMYAVAKRAGVSKQNVGKLMAGTREPSWDTVQRLALALGVSTEAFTDPDLRLPVAVPAKMGRPKKAPAVPQDATPDGVSRTPSGQKPAKRLGASGAKRKGQGKE
jgi:transcriptional regulator with XRE-family HTH domain